MERSFQTPFIDVTNNTAHAALNDALAQMRDDAADPLDQFIRLVDALRPRRADDVLLATARFTTLCEILETDPLLRDTLRGRLLELFADRRQVNFFADSGILPNSGFFSELWRRAVQRVFPAIPDRAQLKDCVNLIFHRRDDHEWLDGISAELKLRFWHALDIARARDEAPLQASFSQMLEAGEILATRIGAMGVEPELVRLYPRIEERGSPFLALAAEMHRLSADYRGYLAGGTAPDEDERQLEVLIGQCHEVLLRVRGRAAAVGTSLTLTYLLRRLEQSLQRLELLMRMLSTRHAEDRDGTQELSLVDLWVEFLGQAVQGEGRRQGMRWHVSQSIGMLALRVTDNASRAGEHYITTTRGEYFQMWRSAMGAGFIVGFMALIKALTAKATLPPLGYLMAFGMNYALGFMLIHVLHLTLATKQPAMTASTIAGVISATRGRIRDVEKLADLVVDLVRSQIAAIAGNVAIAIPTAIIIGLVFSAATGKPLVNVAKAHHLIDELSPIDSLALVHAAIAGVCLFLAGLISGYYDNLAAYERVRERVEHTRWLHRLLGEKNLKRLAAYLDDNLGALAGNFFLGFMLATVGTLGFLTGLPVDVRHVTLSSANFGLALASLDFAVDAGTVAKTLAGILLIGFLNLTVSFSLAVWVALRARGVAFSQSGLLLTILLRRLRTNGKRFFWPGPELPTRKTPD